MVEELDSHALACARLTGDWHGKYGVTPVLAYTYVGPGHAGTSYRAAGWQRCAEATSGTPPGARGQGVRRSVWMKPLAPDWRQVLCREPERVMGQAQPLAGDDGTDWARREYGRSGHNDARIRERLVTMGRAWNDCPGETLPVIFPGEALAVAVEPAQRAAGGFPVTRCQRTVCLLPQRHHDAVEGDTGSHSPSGMPSAARIS